MYEYCEIAGIRNTGECEMTVKLSAGTAAVIHRKNIKGVEIYLEDGRTITALQRRKVYATLNDIAAYTGYSPEEAKETMKYEHIRRTGSRYFSLSDCSVDQAREFINTLIDFCLEYGVQTGDPLLDRTDDIGKYLHQCLVYRKCAICGRGGEVHHWDAIGMGNDRRHYDDSMNRKICLCRTHHVIAHQKGVLAFERSYHVYGIVYQENNADERGKEVQV